MKIFENKEIIVASGNQGKIKEFKELLEPLGFHVKSLKDYPSIPDIIEDGSTFAENAIIKANTITQAFNIAAISDDSGLEIDAWNREPGIYSARFLGHETPYKEKNKIILERMEGVENRNCRYVCAIALTRPGKDPLVFEDTVECEISHEARGENGFGYDPIVLFPPLNKTMAEMTDYEKNEISHRGKAVRKFKKWFDENC